MTVAVLVPWRPGDPHRERAWRYVRRWLRGYEVVMADSPIELFSRGAALNMAAAQTNADVFVAHDADTFVPLAQLEMAVKMAAESPGLVVGYSDAYYLTALPTRRVLRGSRPFSWKPQVEDETHNRSVGGVLVLSRETAERIGGFDDPEFLGWGGGDVAMANLAARVVAPTRRVPGDLWHLHHPMRRERVQWKAGKQLARRYEVADTAEIIERRTKEWHRAHGRPSTAASPASSATN